MFQHSKQFLLTCQIFGESKNSCQGLKFAFVYNGITETCFFAASFSSCDAVVHVRRTTETTKWLLRFQRHFVPLNDSIRMGLWRVLWLIQVATICFMSNKQAALFYLVYRLVVVELCFVNVGLWTWSQHQFTFGSRCLMWRERKGPPDATSCIS